jgi:Zn-dependent peptidase ImmA (M78 family)
MGAVVTEYSPKRTADDLRLAIWKDRAFPVDPVTMAKTLGIQVLETTLPEKVSGAIIKRTGQSPIIVVNRADSRNRKRFSIAHELGHYVYKMLYNGNDDTAFEWIDYRDVSSSAGTDKEEVFANRFAANLLMPEKPVTDEAKRTGRNAILLALYFGVSAEAINIRLKDLDIHNR